MGLDSWLSQNGQIQRGTETLDAYGNASLSYYDVDYVPGRFVEKRQRIWSDERAESIVVTNYLWLMPAGRDVQVRDRLIVDDVTYTITGILARNTRATHHLSLTLERVA